jgi:hypothetical protein
MLNATKSTLSDVLSHLQQMDSTGLVVVELLGFDDYMNTRDAMDILHYYPLFVLLVGRH